MRSDNLEDVSAEGWECSVVLTGPGSSAESDARSVSQSESSRVPLKKIYLFRSSRIIINKRIPELHKGVYSVKCKKMNNTTTTKIYYLRDCLAAFQVL